MRLWHYKLLHYLPDAQFKGQLRELVAIMHDWRDKGKTNHLLINRVMEYPKTDLMNYVTIYGLEYCARYGVYPKSIAEFREFCGPADGKQPFKGWHTDLYLSLCMANLCEKHIFGRGKSRITDEEWIRLQTGYWEITGTDYIPF